MTQMLIPGLIVLAILVAIFFIFRAVALWYWKIDVIVANQKQQIDLLLSQNETRKQHAKVNYYSAMAAGDKQKAYENLLYLIFDDMAKPGVLREDRRNLYLQAKEVHGKTFEKLGYPFPDPDILV